MNRLFQTDGIVLKNIKLNESDKIITIFSRHYGKIRAIAKGIRKTKSQFGSSLENLTLVKIMAFKGKNLNIVSQTEIISSFFLQSKDLINYGIAIQCAEIIDKITEDEDPNEYIYILFKDVLMLLKDEKNATLLLVSFQWKLFSILGYQPELNKCIHCYSNIKENKYYVFDIQKGGLICSSCQLNNNYYQIKITDYCLRLLKRVLAADLSMIHNKKVSQSELGELVEITNRYMLYHFEIENKTKQFIDRIKTIK
jgi:DNA repair protein RecO (recombination protein O)